MNRFLLIILAGIIAALIITGYFTYIYMDQITADTTSFFLSSLASMWQDILFFLLVGISAIIAQFYQHKGEILRKRVHNLFSNKDVSYSTISYIENQIREMSIYCGMAETKLEILEYSRTKKAYRVAFHNKYELCNMFGDVPYKASISANIAPDLIRDDIEILGEVTSISLTNENDEKIEFLTGPHSIPKTGFSQPINLSLEKQGKAMYEMKWWSWVECMGNSGFSMKRFAENYNVSLENKSSMQAGFSINKKGQPEYIKFGESRLLFVKQNVQPNERSEFWWFPPKELEESGVGGMEHIDELHPVLTSYRAGEKPLEPL